MEDVQANSDRALGTLLPTLGKTRIKTAMNVEGTACDKHGTCCREKIKNRAQHENFKIVFQASPQENKHNVDRARHNVGDPHMFHIGAVSSPPPYSAGVVCLARLAVTAPFTIARNIDVRISFVLFNHIIYARARGEIRNQMLQARNKITYWTN